MEVFNKANTRIIEPLIAARKLSEQYNIAMENRTAHLITKDIIEIFNNLKIRWEKFKEYDKWIDNGSKGQEPSFFDEVCNELRSGKYVLAPCELINENLSKLVGLTLKIYSSEKLRSVMRLSELNPETSNAINELRQIAIHAEEAMEQEALNLVFKAVEKNPTEYKEIIENIVRNKFNFKSGEEIPNTKEMKVALLEALIVDFPKQMQEQQPELYKGMVFKYFSNYPPLVKSELDLLKTPFLLQNADAPYFHYSIDDLIKSNPAIEKILNKNKSQSRNMTEFQKTRNSFINNFPEIFGIQNLSEKSFTFVGAGFPLTGLLQHIETNGCNINLVDYDKSAIDSATKLLKITDSLSITKPGNINTFHADARDIEFTSNDIDSVNKKLKIKTDILDLASALPKEVTDEVIRSNSSNIPIIRKRNVRGISEILYEKYSLPNDCNFRLAGHITPPQKILSGASPESIVTNIASAINVNSSDLYINELLLKNKLKDLDSGNNIENNTANTPNPNVLDGKAMWGSRIQSYYK